MSEMHYNFDYLNNIFNGNTKEIASVVTLFLQQLPEAMRQLEQAKELREPEKLRRAAHKIKSSLRAIGADALGNLAARIEIQSDNDEKIIDSLCEQLLNELPILEKQLKQYLASCPKK
jgi:HPt (histidine-containing phosphotransfer) domain-containing protein